MGQCKHCGLEWEKAWRKDNPFVDDPTIDVCAYCQAMIDAWRTKNKAEIRYWTRRYIRMAGR